jgi:inosose dehydratase
MHNRGVMPPSRREFLATLGAAAAAAALPAPLRADGAPYPPLDLSPFDRPITPRPFALRLGCASILWGGDDEKAIDEIAALGFRGIQLRSNVIPRYGEKPEELRRRLDERKLALLCFSSGNVNVDPAQHDALLETHVSHARFAKTLGGAFMQVTSERPKGRAPSPEDYERLGRLLTEIGRRTLDLGVRLVYHNHMGGFGEAPEDLPKVLDASDRHYVSLLLDIAHYAQGGGDPAAAVSRHAERLAFLHLKDVRNAPAPEGRPARDAYQFVEMGRGRVDIPQVIAALKKISFRGPAVLELDDVPDPGRTPRDSAETNRRYAVETLGLSLES